MSFPRPLQPDLPLFVSFGEAMTDLVRVGHDEWRSVCGGAPWNVAAAMAALGEPSAFAGSISHDVFGHLIWQASAEAGLDLRFIQQYARPPLLSFMQHAEPQEQVLVGGESADLFFRTEDLPGGWMRALRWAHFGSLALVREPLAPRLLVLAECLRLEGKRISYQPGYRPLMCPAYDRTLEHMCRMADVVKVSEEELRGLFRCADPLVGQAQIGAWNPQVWLLITRDDGGASLYQGTQEWHAEPRALEGAAAAGEEAMLAGLLHSLLRQPDAQPTRHLRWALAAALSARHGARQPPYAEVATLALRIRVRAGP